ncbi:MAG: hypothetical protein IPP26_10590 [Flavobacteriales bacterium]|nr:hypothetical protein [Flavobacteriales bacterium]
MKGFCARLVYYGAALLLLASAALWNGYPLLYPDSASYIQSGAILETPVDRPITYGLFLRVVTLNFTSLWSAVLVQCLIAAYAVRRLCRSFVLPSWCAYVALLAASCAGLPLLTGQIITDVFSSVVILVSFILFKESERSVKEHWALWALLLVAYAMHGSHLPIMAGMLGLYGLATWLGAKELMRGRRRVLVGFAVVMLIGYVPMNISAVKTGDQFYAAHLAETGILQAYLDKNCDRVELKMCARKDSIPVSAEHFMWHPGGVAAMYSGRLEAQREYDVVISGVFQDPELRWQLLQSTLAMWWSQLLHNAPGEGMAAFGPGTNVHAKMESYLPAELPAMERSRQASDAMFDRSLHRLARLASVSLMTCLVLALPLVFFAMRRRTKGISVLFAWVVLGYVLLNALVNSGFVLVANRFGAKTVWLIPIAVVLLLCGLLTERSTKSPV